MMTSQRTPEMGMVKLCGAKGCCPTIDFTDSEKIILKDDFGGKVELTREQWADLKARFAWMSDHQG